MQAYTRVLNQLNEIAKESGPKAKAPLLNLYLQDEDFRRIVQMMLNPFVTFGINSFTWAREAEIVMDPVTDEEFYKVLDQLSSRRLTGDNARATLTNLTTRGVPGELLYRILTADPRAGFQAGPVNKIIPGLIPEFSYMRCSRPSQVKNGLDYKKGIIVQVKSDGMFINLDREVDSVLMTTRQGNPLPSEKFPRVVEAAMALKVGTQTHGELVVYRDGVLLPREQGNGLINSIIEGENLSQNEQVYLHVWDQIPRTAAVKKGKYNVPYISRLAELHTQLLSDVGYVQVIEYRVCCTKEDSKAFFKEVLLRGGEGTVEKDPEMFWEDGTSKGQIKNKGEFECDLIIKGYREGKGKYTGQIGSIIGQSSEGLLEVAVSGISEELRKKISLNRSGYLETIMNVKYNVITSPSPSNSLHSLFLPRLNELCKDKSEAESLEKIKADYEDVIANM